jgi:hypothetical protein
MLPPGDSHPCMVGLQGFRKLFHPSYRWMLERDQPVSTTIVKLTAQHRILHLLLHNLLYLGSYANSCTIFSVCTPTYIPGHQVLLSHDSRIQVSLKWAEMATNTILLSITREAGDIITKKRNGLGYVLLHFF